MDARRFGREDGGQAIVLVAITFLGLLMTVGLAVDAGQLYSARRTMQEAADAAAFGAAVVLYQGGTAQHALDAAAIDATSNGYTDGLGDIEVEINSPPLSGPYALPHASATRYIEVIITAQVRTTLVPAQSVLSSVRVRGVAGAEPLNSGFAIMALNSGNTPDAFTLGPTGQLDLLGGGILVNSSHADAASNEGTITLEAGYGTLLHGGLDDDSDAFPNQTLGAPQLPDPFAGYPKPSTLGMTVYDSLPPGGLQPGIYTVRVADRTLAPGIYIFEAGLGGDVEGTGVFIFNTKTGYPNSGPGDTCGAIAAAGNHDITLTAMTTGTYAGLLLYQDPICTAAMTFNGSSFSLNYTGTFYAPTAAVRLTGHADISGGQFVADTFDLQNGDIDIRYDAGTSAQPVLPRLAE